MSTHPPVADTPTAMAWLKSHTLDAHRRTEAVVDAGRRLATPDGYADLLAIFAMGLVPVEAAIADHPHAAEVPDRTARRFGPLLLEDLRALDREVPVEGSFPLPPDAASLAGAVYVVEGSSLGGVHLARATLSADPDRPVRYLRRYGEQTGPMWRRVGQWVHATVDTEAERTRAVATALAVFDRVQRAAASLTVSSSTTS